MYRLCIGVALFVGTLSPASAQNTNHRQPRPEQTQDLTSDAKRAEINAQIEAGRRREDASNMKTLDLWSRWTYAVCIGCGDEPKNVRTVYTTPARVLAGIPAAQDDAREQRVGRRSSTSRTMRRRVADLVY